MSSLADIQRQMRAAILVDPAAEIPAALIGGREPLKRLAIHRRHYETSLIEALLRRFPATHWLLGTRSFTETARAYVYHQPPTTPCIAEYGSDFPGYLASRPAGARVPGLSAFGELEWRLGEIALCIDHPPCSMARLADVATQALPEVSLRLQPGLRYVEAAWPVDELMVLYLNARAPSQYVMAPCPIRLQISGARGAFWIERLDPPVFVFRRALADGQAIGVAAERALEAEPTFDIGDALAKLVAEGRMIGFELPSLTGGDP
jgi:hypothetical protein